MDCTAQDNPCGPGLCSELAGGCAAPALDEHCVIDGDCLEGGDWHPEVPCLRCLPEVDKEDWSVIPGRCHVDGICYEADDEIGGQCAVCDPLQPDSATALADGSGCDDDASPCTADYCLSGVCAHPVLTGEVCDDGDPCTHTDVCQGDGSCGGVAYACDDGLDCTADICVGDGSCAVQMAEDICVIESICVEAATPMPGSGECSFCSPVNGQEGWTAQPDNLPCEDGDPCTTNDSCLDGLCLGQVKDCHDGADCTADTCIAGNCVHEIADDVCLIEGICVEDGATPHDSPARPVSPLWPTTPGLRSTLGLPANSPTLPHNAGTTDNASSSPASTPTTGTVTRSRGTAVRSNSGRT